MHVVKDLVCHEAVGYQRIKWSKNEEDFFSSLCLVCHFWFLQPSTTKRPPICYLNLNVHNKDVFSKHMYHGLYYNSLILYVSLDHHILVIKQGDTQHTTSSTGWTNLSLHHHSPHTKNRILYINSVSLSVRQSVNRGPETQITFNKTIPPNSRAQKLLKTSSSYFLLLFLRLFSRSNRRRRWGRYFWDLEGGWGDLGAFFLG
jgi:hypothetical protein